MDNPPGYAFPSSALHKKSWAVIDRPYSLGCATVGALYERPRCIFCAKPSLWLILTSLKEHKTSRTHLSDLSRSPRDCGLRSDGAPAYRQFGRPGEFRPTATTESNL